VNSTGSGSCAVVGSGVRDVQLFFNPSKQIEDCTLRLLMESFKFVDYPVSEFSTK
jgi:hypothetical protein